MSILRENLISADGPLIVGIASVTPEYYVGIGGDLIWRFKEDLRFFKLVTKNKVVIMGRKTFVSIPNKPLRNRVNIVISAKSKLHDLDIPEYTPCDSPIIIAESPMKALSIAKGFNKTIFVVGGAQIWEEMEDLIKMWILFRITAETPREVLNNPHRCISFPIPLGRIQSQFEEFPGPPIFDGDEFGKEFVGEYHYFYRTKGL